jgi:hypothetical protein
MGDRRNVVGLLTGDCTGIGLSTGCGSTLGVCISTSHIVRH